MFLQLPLPLHSKIGNDEDEEDVFKPNKPISLPSLENPPDAGPMYNTCKSVTGVEVERQTQDQERVNEDDAEQPFIPNKPIELDSLQDIDRSFLGLQPRSNNNNAAFDDDNSEVPLLMETGLGVITSSVIFGGSLLFVLSVFFDDGDNIDPTMIPFSF